MKSYIIHLVRHGMTSANIEGKYAGTTDLPLCESGIKQLNELCEKYDYGNPQLIFTSPLKRCLQTAHILYGKNATLNVVENLHEVCMGDFEGKSAEQLQDDSVYLSWVRGEIAPPNGEPNNDFAKRVCTAFVQTVRDIMKTGITESAICAHGGVIMILLSVYGLPQQESINWMTNNGRGFTIRVTPSVFMRTGMVEVISEYPQGSLDEPDLSINPVKKNSEKFGGKGVFGLEQTKEPDIDFDEESEDVFWADVEDLPKDTDK